MSAVVYKWAYLRCGKCRQEGWDVRAYNARGEDLSPSVAHRCANCRFPTSSGARETYFALCVRLAGARQQKGGR